jgi:hypothetical protein
MSPVTVRNAAFSLRQHSLNIAYWLEKSFSLTLTSKKTFSIKFPCNFLPSAANQTNCQPQAVCFFSWRYNPLWLYFHSPVAGFSLLVFEVSWSHTTRHSRQDSSGRVINPSQRPLPDNTQHSQQTNIQAPGEIRTHNLSRLAAEDLRLRPRGHWDRQLSTT